MQKSTRSNRQHTTQRPSTIKKTPELSSGRDRQRKSSTSQTNDTNTTMSNMGGLLRSRIPDRGSTPSSKPSPFSPNSSRNQAMLNNSKEINTGLQHHISMSKSTSHIEHFNSHRARKRTRVTSPSQSTRAKAPFPTIFQRVPTIQKNTNRRKRGLTFFEPAISPECSLSPINHTCIITMETGLSH